MGCAPKLAGLEFEVTINVDEYGVPHIFANNEHDMFMAQGYMTARDRLVQMELTRRRGKGRLAEIMGPKQIGSDWRVLTLGILRTAQAQLDSYRRENSPMLDVLRTYADGVNAWIEQARAGNALPAFFKMMGYEPEPWTALDSLVMQGMVTENLAFQTGQLERAAIAERLGKERADQLMPEMYVNPQTPWAPGPYAIDAPVDTETLLDALIYFGPDQGVGGLVANPPQGAPPNAMGCDCEYSGPSAGPDAGGSPGAAGAAGSSEAGSKPEVRGCSSVDGCSGAGGDCDAWSAMSVQDHSHPHLGNSNNWVVGGALTDTGRPCLAGDPHLGLTIPSIWHEVHLKCPTIHVYGVIFPGIPGVMIGHNEKVVWSPTNGQNVQAFYYLEKVDPTRPDYYYHNGRWVKFGEYRVTIPVRGQSPKQVSIPWTVHGPVIDRCLPKMPPMPHGAVVSLAYTGNLLSDLMRALYELDKAQNADDVEQALSHWGSPVQNFAYAASDGDFGIISAGYFPVPKSGNPWELLPGTGEADWAGFIPQGRTPEIRNPEWGYATSSNERQVGPDYPYAIGSSDNRFCAGWRSRAINEFLKDSANHPLTMESIAGLQACNLDSLAAQVAPVLTRVVRGAPPVSREATAAAEILEQWDFVMRKEQAAPAIWDTFLACYFKNLFEPWWRWSGLSDLKHFSLEDIHLSSAGWNGAMLAALEAISAPPQLSQEPQASGPASGSAKSVRSWLYDPIWGEERRPEHIMLLSLIDAVGALGKKLGADMTKWQWGEVHHRLVPSLLEKKELGRGPYPSDGGGRCPNTTGGAEPAVHGPSWRMVVSLTDPVKSWAVYPGGQSEDPSSPHYDDQLKLWLDYKYKDIHFTFDPVSVPGDYIREAFVISPVN